MWNTLYWRPQKGHYMCIPDYKKTKKKIKHTAIQEHGMWSIEMYRFFLLILKLIPLSPTKQKKGQIQRLLKMCSDCNNWIKEEIWSDFSED